MSLEFVKAVFEVIFLVADFSIIVACSSVHFVRGGSYHGTRDGFLTLLIFIAGGMTASIFHFFRHELPRQKHRSKWKQCSSVLCIFVPSYYVVKWNLLRFKQPESHTVKSWTASLMLFHCSIGSLIQGIFQSYVVVSLWWTPEQRSMIYIMIFGATFFSLYALHGICNYIFTQYYDELHKHLSIKDKILVVIAFFLSIGGRVSAMAVVMVTLRWELFFGPVVAFIINLTFYISVCINSMGKKEGNAANPDRDVKYVFQFVFLILLAFLSTMTISDHRPITLVTFMIWVLSYLGQFVAYHYDVSTFFVWCIPTAAQLAAVILVIARWKVFETAFERFKRVAKN